MKYNFLLLLAMPLCLSPALHAQSNAFTYQGSLASGGSPATGQYDLVFALFDAGTNGSAIGVTITNGAVQVSGGLFNTALDFGAGAFTGAARWLEISVRTNGSGAFVKLIPRQALTASPYAIYAANAGVAAGLATTGAQALDIKVNGRRGLRLEPTSLFETVNVVGGSPYNYIAPGAAGSVIAGGGYTDDGANLSNSIASETSFIGGGKANTIQDNAASSVIGGGGFNLIQRYTSYSSIPGGEANVIGTGAFASLIGGGFANSNAGSYAVLGGGKYNTLDAHADAATIGGGASNFIGGYAANGVIGGGFRNTIQTNATHATIGGGNGNTVRTSRSTIGGGGLNSIGTNASASTIAGGSENIILDGAVYSTIGGGVENGISGSVSTVPGGSANYAQGDGSFAAGILAWAQHNFCFVWSDRSLGYGSSYTSTGTNQFCVLAAGGVHLGPNTSLNFENQFRQFINLGTTNNGIGVQSAATYFRSPQDFYWYRGGAHHATNGNSGGGVMAMALTAGGLTVNGTFASTSDRNAKEDFKAVSVKEVLAKVANLPITTWSYKQDNSVKHIGPVAQDFQAAFGVGTDDKHIATVDADGVALAAIRGLYEIMQEKDSQMKSKDAEIAELNQRLSRLEKIVSTLAPR